MRAKKLLVAQGALLVILGTVMIRAQSNPERRADAYNGSGSNPSDPVTRPTPGPNPPPPPPRPPALIPTITGSTLIKDKPATTPSYPQGTPAAQADTNLKLKNGNFATYDGDLYGGFKAFAVNKVSNWKAISGSLVELQNYSGSNAVEVPYCELDADWNNNLHEYNVVNKTPSDHGIQQTVTLDRGHHLLYFDYRGRDASSGSASDPSQPNASPRPYNQAKADSFVIKTKLTADTASKELTRIENASTSTWKRGVLPFEMQGIQVGMPVSVELSLDILSDPADGLGMLVDNLVLAPFTFEEVSPNSGLDNQSSPSWIMVPEGGSNQAKVVSAARSQPAAQQLKFGLSVLPEGSSDSASPNSGNDLDESPETITVTGGSTGTSSQVAVTLGDVKADAGLHIAVEPYHTFTVAIHGITQAYSTYQLPPGRVPSEALLQQYLNSVYGPQSNTYFYVIRSDATLNYDREAQNGGNNLNQKLDCSVNANALSNEQQIIAGNFNASADYDLYYVDAFSYSSVPNAVGLAYPNLKKAFVSAGATSDDVAAHEIGHLLGLGHSNGPGSGLIPQTTESQCQARLMYSHGANANKTLLIKPEWETIRLKKPNQQ